MGVRGLGAEARRARIAERVQHAGSVFVDDICREFGVSEVTARTDLSALEQEGRLTRIRGGAVAPPSVAAISYPAERVAAHLDAKRAIGRAAASLVHDGDVVFLDTGTTTLCVAEELGDRSGIVLVTADLAIASFASLNLPHARTILLPGRLWPNRLYLTGPEIRERLANIYGDIAFLNANLVDAEGSCWTEFEPDARTKRLFMDHATKAILLADASKVVMRPNEQVIRMERYPARFARLDEFEAHICEREPWQEAQPAAGSRRTVTMVAPS